MNVLFWERCDFHVSFSCSDMSKKVWNRPSGSSMVDMVISSNIMKFPSPKCNITFWDMIIYSGIFHWSDIWLNRDLVTELDLITVYRFLHYYLIPGGFHRTLQRVRLANRGRLILRTPGPVQFVTCIFFLCWDHSFLNLWCLRTFFFFVERNYFCHCQHRIILFVWQNSFL